MTLHGQGQKQGLKRDRGEQGAIPPLGAPRALIMSDHKASSSVLGADRARSLPGQVNTCFREECIYS